MRVLAVDVGAVRIGLALSDPRGVIASPLETLAGHAGSGAVGRVVEIVSAREVQRVVVGLPLELSGKEGHATRRSRMFVEALRSRLTCEVVEFDERFTSVTAERSLIESNIRRQDRKSVIDQAAATLLLQAYLDGENARLRRAKNDHDDSDAP